MRPGLAGLVVAAAVVAAGSVRAGEERVDFNRDVRPILAGACFTCHGPDPGTRKAGLRLDERGAVVAELPSGSRAVVPGDAESSELVARVEETDFDAGRMPPRETGKELTAGQAAVLRRWVEQGAEWGEHWSVSPLRRPRVPLVRDAQWVVNPIDAFVLGRLEGEGIAPSAAADRVTLARRLALDLTGLPPAPERVEAFAHDEGADAVERLVDRLLASPEYGERMAAWWLDLVRFADTVGYHSDVPRSIALYRDYVIRSFNANVPFDRFTVEQLAGDLLPERGDWERVASAYNMLGMTTEEGGAQPLEYTARHAADRVRNVGSVWMGATLGCAECHDHKYDPYTSRDFYAMAAFFADIEQPGVGTPKPTLAMPTAEQAAQLAAVEARIAELSKAPDSAAELKAARERKVQIEGQIRRTIVTVSGPPRVTRVLHRGDWMDETGEVVEPAVPRFLGAVRAGDGGRASRLELARWLVGPSQPQTARVLANRLWARFFGAGLSDSLEDCGLQGEWPSHPELLDWLAAELVASGWDVKHVVRLIVTSATYRQASAPREELAVIDPRNRLLARQNAVRLEAEPVRDGALAASGLLVRRLGGESVRPYQPAGYWRFLNFPVREYEPSAGADQYRRGVYTHWQRSLLHPSLLAFDAPSREFCTAKRAVSNTPQAALVLLNDPSFVEAARGLAERVLGEAGRDEERVERMWRLVVARGPTEGERRVVLGLLGRHREAFASEPEAARALLGVGQPARGGEADAAEVAAWTSVARVVLNLDEAITRE